MRLILGSAAVLMAFMTAVACVGTDVPSEADRDGGPVGASDAATSKETGDPADAAAPSGQGVILLGDFETTNCVGWQSNGATQQSDLVAHGGKTSCRVCDPSNGTANPVWGLFQNVSNVAAGTYVARGFAHAAGDAGPFEVVLRLQALDDAGQEVDPMVERTLTVVPDREWVTDTMKIGLEPGQGVAFGVLSTTGGGCFLVDDVTLVKE